MQPKVPRPEVVLIIAPDESDVEALLIDPDGRLVLRIPEALVATMRVLADLRIEGKAVIHVTVEAWTAGRLS